MTDRIVIRNIQAEGRHGVYEHELIAPQPFEVDVELVLDLEPAGRADDLALTVDYAQVDAIVRRIVESKSFSLLETIAETIAREVLAEFDIEEIGVRVRKPTVQLGGPVDYAGVEIRRRRPTG